MCIKVPATDFRTYENCIIIPRKGGNYATVPLRKWHEICNVKINSPREHDIKNDRKKMITNNNIIIMRFIFYRNMCENVER